MTRRTLILPAALLLTAAPAAAELPEPVRAMIEAAIATGDPDTVKAVVDMARATNPGEDEAIDALHTGFLAEQRELAAREEAQKIEDIRTAGLFGNWSGEGQIGGFHSAGNTNAVGLTAALSLDREGIDWTHRLRARLDYRRNEGQLQREQYLASYEPRYQINEGLFVYGLGQFDRDTFQGFASRYVVSLGAGYKVLDSKDLQLSIRGGPAFRRTNFTNGTRTSNIAGLLGVDLGWTIADNIKLTQDTNAVAEGGGEALAVIDSQNFSLNVITGLEVGLSSDLTARMSYALEYNSSPPPGAEGTDGLTRLTLVYGF